MCCISAVHRLILHCYCEFAEGRSWVMLLLGAAGLSERIALLKSHSKKGMIPFQGIDKANTGHETRCSHLIVIVSNIPPAFRHPVRNDHCCVDQHKRCIKSISFMKLLNLAHVFLTFLSDETLSKFRTSFPVLCEIGYSVIHYKHKTVFGA